jgi:membrane protein YdbS with pleckstrin-like domain
MTDDAPVTDHAPAVAGLRPPANRLDPEVRRLWLIEGVLASLALIVVSGGVLLAVHSGTDGLPMLAWVGWGAAGAALLAASVASPAIVYPYHRWEVTDLGLYVQKGRWWRSWMLVPHSRIQAVDTTAGPLERSYGLRTVHVRTASDGGSGTVPGLSAHLADRLTRELAAHAGEGEAA